jgi:hypothetical protein
MGPVAQKFVPTLLNGFEKNRFAEEKSPTIAYMLIYR